MIEVMLGPRLCKQGFLHVHDLHAADVVYHKVCSINFRTSRYQQFTSMKGTHPNGQKLVGHNMRREEMHSYKLLDFWKKTTMSKSQLKI